MDRWEPAGKQLVTQWRTTPRVADRDADKLTLLPPERISLALDGGPAAPAHASDAEGATMERKTAHDFDQDLLVLFDAYVHGALDRRGFLDKAAKYAVGGVTAAMLLDQLSPKFLEAQVVKPEDPRI